MPIYEYKCSHCGNCFELLSLSAHNKKIICPACGKPAKRIISPVGIQFKGSGFYTTDSKRGSHGVPARSKESEKDKPAAKESKKDSGKTTE